MAATITSKEKKRKKEKVASGTKTFADLQAQLMNAVVQCKPKVVKRLMDQRIDPNCTNELGETPLILACQLEDDESRRMIASLLIKRDANLNIQDVTGNSAISNAVKNNDEQLVETLIEKGVDISQISGEGNSLLCCAATNGNVNITKLVLREVLKQKLPVDHKNMHGLTPLLLAAQGGHINVAKMLVSTGKASITIRDLDHFMTAEQWMKQSGLYLPQEIAFLSPKSRHRRKNATKSLFESVMDLESESSPNIFTLQSSKNEEKQRNSFVSLPNISSPSLPKKTDDAATRSMFDLPAISTTSLPKSNMYSTPMRPETHFKTEQLPSAAGSKRDIFASSYLNKRKAIVERNRKSKFYAQGSLEPLHSDSVPSLPPPPSLTRMNSISETTDERKNQDYNEKKQHAKLPPL